MQALAALERLSADEVHAALDDPAARVVLIRQGAEAGLAEAQAVWGQMLLDGTGIARDQRTAFGWFMRAAAQGHAMALNMVGRCYDGGWGVGIDKVRAAECFRAAAGRGLPEAMYNHATALTLGEGVAEDRKAALAWFERAAAAGYAKAWNHIGSFHEDGWVVERDLAQASAFYARAAEAGDFRGAFNHARMLAADGRLEEALGWLERAGEWGNAPFVAKAIRWCEACDVAALRARGPDALRKAARC